jgi:hypothetical protein
VLSFHTQRGEIFKSRCSGFGLWLGRSQVPGPLLRLVSHTPIKPINRATVMVTVMIRGSVS